MKRDILKIETIHECNCCLGNKTLHPLVSVIDLSKVKLTDYSMKFNFYTMLLIENECDVFVYGRTPHDYSNATLVFLSPGQSIKMDKSRPLPCSGWLLAFHPNLICDTTLGMNIDHYTFFSYHLNEALHLSQREEAKVIECLINMEQELQHDIDRHSRILISRYIELLLDYCCRFYERQFITRCEINNELLSQMELLLDQYIQSGKLESKVFPTATYCADALHLSTHYFSDLLKFETGKTIDDYFQTKRIEVARQMLLSSEDNTVSRVAQRLGFPNVPCFSKLFQKITGALPREYKLGQCSGKLLS